jgi:hypothetical protein
MTPAYIVSSLTSYGVVTETPRVPVAPGQVSGPVSLNGLLPPPDSQVPNDAYQPQSRVVGGPGLLYSFPSDNRPYDGHSAMPIQGHPSSEALNALPSQQFQATGQLDNINIAQSHSQPPFVFQGLPVNVPTNGVEFQQYQNSPNYTVSQDLYPVPSLRCTFIPSSLYYHLLHPYIPRARNWQFLNSSSTIFFKVFFN